jgi:hypothetical protein
MHEIVAGRHPKAKRNVPRGLPTIPERTRWQPHVEPDENESEPSTMDTDTVST